MTFSLLVCHAQQENKYLEDRIDSLEIKLNKLQHDHNLLLCQHELDILVAELKDLSQELSIEIDNIGDDGLHKIFDYKLYTGYKDKYETLMTLYATFLLRFEIEKEFISSINEKSKFHESELKRMKVKIDFIEEILNTIKEKFEIVKSLFDSYKKFMMESSKPKRSKRRPDYYD